MQIKNQLIEVELGRKFIKTKIPKDWNLTKLDDLTATHGRIGWKNLRADEYIESGPLMLSVWSLVDESPYGVDYTVGVKRLSKFRYDESPEIKLENADVLLSKDGDIGRVGFVKELPEPATVNSHVVVVRVTNTVLNPEFLYWFMKSKPFQTYCVSFTSGTTVPLLTQKNLKDAIIPIPPKLEQQKIASILSDFDSLIQQIQKIIEQTQRLKKGLMQMLLTKGIGHTKFQSITLIPKYLSLKIPSHWTVKKLESIVSQSISYGIILHKYDPEGISVITSGALDQKDGIRNNLIKVKKEIEEKYKRTRLQGSEILISLVGYTGNVVVVPDWCKGFNVTRHVGVIRLEHDYLPDYFAYLLKSEIYQKKIKIMTIGSAQPVINLKILSKFPIIIPPKEEQKKIIGILTNVDFQIQTQQNHKSNLETLKKGLMQKLLTGQIRVKV